MRLINCKKAIAALMAAIIVSASGIVLSFGSRTRADGFNPGIEAFVTSLYVDCLGRNPDPEGFNYWCSNLANGTVTGKQCAYGFFFSDEYRFIAASISDNELVNIYYRVFLNRTADPAGQAYWMNKISNTVHDITILFNGFADSNEFAQKCASYGVIAGNHIEAPLTSRLPGEEDYISDFITIPPLPNISLW